MLPIQVLTRHEAGVNCLAVYGNLVFTGSEDKDIKVITVFIKYQLYTCNFHKYSICFSRKPKQITFFCSMFL